MPDEAEVQRVVLHARTGGVDVFSTHLAWQLHDAALRERQVQALVRFVDERTDPAASLGPVVAGDFNAEPDSTAIRYLCGLAALDGASTYLQDAWRLAGDGGPGITWSNANPHAALDREPERRLDYVFSGFHGPTASDGRSTAGSWPTSRSTACGRPTTTGCWPCSTGRDDPRQVGSPKATTCPSAVPAMSRPSSTIGPPVTSLPTDTVTSGAQVAAAHPVAGYAVICPPVVVA